MTLTLEQDTFVFQSAVPISGFVKAQLKYLLFLDCRVSSYPQAIVHELASVSEEAQSGSMIGY